MYALDQKEKNNLTSDLRGSFVSESMIENQAVLEDLEIQTFTNIITGQSPVDEFDSFVEQWNALGRAGWQFCAQVNGGLVFMREIQDES